MTTPERAEHNFCAVSTLDDLGHGGSRPGYPSTGANESAVRNWIIDMKSRSIQHVLSLLGDDEVNEYACDVDGLMQEAFGEGYTRTSVYVPGAYDAVLNACKAAQTTRSRIVIHCSGGAGRAAIGMAVWIMTVHGKSAEEAVQVINEKTQSEPGIDRKPNVDKVKYFVENGSLIGFKK